MKYLLLISIGIFTNAFANGNYRNPQNTSVINNYTTELTEITEISQLQDYECSGVAIAQAGANNTMYMGTKKPQLSLGIGECGGEFASSLMGGMRINNNLLVSGSWATDEDVDAFGIGLSIIFK